MASTPVNPKANKYGGHRDSYWSSTGNLGREYYRNYYSTIIMQNESGFENGSEIIKELLGDEPNFDGINNDINSVA